MTLREYYKIHENEINSLIISALKEDKVKQDVTSNLCFNEKTNRSITSVLLCKQDGILAGLEIFKKVFQQVNPGISFKGNKFKDGSAVKIGDAVLQIKGRIKDILGGERTALNFIQRMSGIATLTNYFVSNLKYPYAKILHTRKTTPNFRVFEIAAVKTGGGDFHRYDLSSAVMIKDNHITGSKDLKHLLEHIDFSKVKNTKRFEVELKNMDELRLVAENYSKYAGIVMLDNFNPEQIYAGSEILSKKGIKVEISGGINMQNFSSIQHPKVNYYSIGMLTHSYKSLDFSLEF
jgi:nicotinate-nucleotide pyrophosphorylase (carboxylating)